MDGRDIGTVVFPKAEIKIFVTANLSVRASRRQKELVSKEQSTGLEEVQQNLEHRDLIDTTRENSPLKQAEGALLLDTTNHTRESQLEAVMKFIENHSTC